MIWTKRLILALILFSVASPALAGIEQFTDDRGILHITNSSKEKTRLEERDEDVSPPPRHLPRTPPTVQSSPPQPGADQPEPAETDKEESKPSSYLTVQKGVIHITNIRSKPVEMAQTQPTPAPVPAAETPAAPVLPVALAQTAAPPAPPLQPVKLAGASVKTYKDNKGVIHIRNSPPAMPPVRDILVAGWSSQPGPKAFEEVAGAFKDTGTILARKPEPLEALPIRKASWFPGEPLGGLPVMPAAVSRGTSLRSAKGVKAKVRRFRDAKGVLHIVGQDSAPGDHFPAPPDRMITQTGLTPVALGPSYPTLPRPSLPAWPEPTVSLRRDKQGRLVIQNAPRRGATKGDKEDVRSQLAPVLLEAAYLFALPVSLVEAVIKVESNFQPAALSPKGAMGLMQLMPGTAKFLGVTDAFCPRENILGGTRYLRLLLDFFGQSLPLALAAYNAGFQRVIDAGWRVPEIKETQDFVAKVMGHYYLREKQYAAQRLLL